MSRPFTIALWGHYHGRNLGDEMVVAILIDAIRVRRPGARVVGISMRPESTRVDHGIEAFPLNPVRSSSDSADDSIVSEGVAPVGSGRARSWLGSVPGARAAHDAVGDVRGVAREVPFILRSWRMLRGVDLIVVAGSGQLLDEWHGARLHPYTTFRWAWLARLSRVRMVYASVGAGPIQSRASVYLIRTAVEMADLVSVRDEASAVVLRSIGVRRELPICPDMAYAYSVDPRLPSRPVVDVPRPIIAVNVMAHQDPRYWPRGEAARYERYVDTMAEVVRRILDRGWSVRLFSSQARADGPATDDVLGKLERSGHAREARLSSVMQSVASVRDLVAEIEDCDGVIAGRFHPVLLSMVLGIPVVGLAYNPKTSELLSAAGLAGCALDIDTFSVDSLLDALDRARAWTDEERAAVAVRVAASRDVVEAQFDQLFGEAPVLPDAGALGQQALR